MVELGDSARHIWCTSSNRTHDRQCKLRDRRIVAGERQRLLNKLHDDATTVQSLNGPEEVCNVPGQAVHAVNYQHVALAGIVEGELKLGPVGVLARRVVNILFVHLNPIELPNRILIDR